MATALTPQQTSFVKHLTKLTGLNSRVVSAWVLAEMGGANSAAAQKRVKARNNNWLNIGYFDSGPGAITKDKVFGDPASAARATAQFLKGEKFGASPGIRKILSSAGGSQQAQIKAIAGSGWASSSYNGGNTLRQLLGQAPAPGAASGPGGASAPAAAAGQKIGVTDEQAAAAVAAAQALIAGQGEEKQVVGGMSLPAPAFSAGPSLAGIQVASSGPRGPSQSQSIGKELAGVAAAQAAAQIQDLAGELKQPEGSGAASGAQAPAVSDGKVVVASGADRKGVGLQKPILGLLKQVSAISGRPITVTTGSNHNRMTTSGNVSDHWDGNAADLGVGGDARESKAVAKKGDLIAAHAIQAVAGVSFQKALKMARQGGIHNFKTKQGRVQIIWRTDQGGNHFNHVHVGLNPNR